MMCIGVAGYTGEKWTARAEEKRLLFGDTAGVGRTCSILSKRGSLAASSARQPRSATVSSRARIPHARLEMLH
jgi:hypothetical protein